MRVEELGLTFGDLLQIQIGDNVEQRYPVKCIGINPVSSIIVSAPMTGKDTVYFVREGQNVTLRFVVKNVVSGFSTRVMLTRGQPYPYLHLEIPKDVQTVEVRKEIRVETDIDMTLLNKTSKSPAMTAKMTNLSFSGGRVESSKEIASLGDVINIMMPLSIGNVEKLVTIDCKVSYMKEDNSDSHPVYGVSFENIDEDDGLILRCFIYQELLIGMHMI
ncbi:MAG: flagellar brake protein [Enterobacterales bacterium]|nr:flagellar brake protein [Enterobacterales bacterium]